MCQRMHDDSRPDGANFLVRGYNSTSSSSPLIIVDGFERPFPNVNPDEIESISILKDAAAAAVYGVRGANGVIKYGILFIILRVFMNDDKKDSIFNNTILDWQSHHRTKRRIA